MEDREIQLKLVFTNYEMDFMAQFLNSYVQKIKRLNPNLTFGTHLLSKKFALTAIQPKFES